MKGAIGNSLGWVASEELQNRFAINGDTAHYLTIDDLVSSADYAIRHFPKCVDLTPTANASFQQLNAALDDFLTLPMQEQWVTSELWTPVRDAARKCLETLDFDLRAFERRELNNP